MAIPVVLKDRYQIKERIGEGGMGEVYRAYDKLLERDAAVKVILEKFQRHTLELFDREWKALGELQHGNIVSVYDRGEFREGAATRPFFVMPFLRGRTLDDLIYDAGTRLSVPRIVRIISDVCRGLQAAHSRNIIHCDIKPSNIFVLEGDSVQIIDFGVMHLMEAGKLTTIKGTQPYMAPELLDIRSRKPPSPRSDIFSLAVVCYEALTGKHPFMRATDKETERAILTEMPVPARDRNREVSLSISQVVQRGMAKSEVHRYGSAAEFADKLERALRNEPLPEFSRAGVEPRLKVVREAYSRGELTSADNILRAIESEGHVDPDISLLREQVDRAIRHKSAEQSLTSARYHREAGQYLEALETIRTVLDRDPDNTEALTQKQDIENEWVQSLQEQARRYANAHQYSEARQVLDDAVRILPDHPGTAEAMQYVGRLEKEEARIGEQQEELYQEARKAFVGGDFERALDKMEKVVELRQRSAAGPTERDAMYSNFHQQVRDERNRLADALDDCRKLLAQEEFARARTVCEGILNSHPGHPPFVALKQEIDNRERQSRLKFINEISARVDAMPDLDERIRLLQQAAERFPAESQFQDLLRHTRDRREHVAMLLSQARKLEEQGEYRDALQRWQAIHDFHPSYPGLEANLHRVRRLHEEQLAKERRERTAEEIERLIENGEYASADRRCAEMLAEFPGDPRATELQDRAQESGERAVEAGQLLDRASALVKQGRVEEALPILRQALQLNQKSKAIRQHLGAALIERGREVLSLPVPDLAAAEEFEREARTLIPEDPTTRHLAMWIADRKKRDRIEDCLARSQELASRGDLQSALAEIQDCLKSYPNDAQLTLQQNNLVKRLGRTPRPPSDYSENQKTAPLTPPGPAERRASGPGRPGSGVREPEPVDETDRAGPVPPEPRKSLADAVRAALARMLPSSGWQERFRQQLAGSRAKVAVPVLALAVAIVVGGVYAYKHRNVDGGIHQAGSPVEIVSSPPGATVRVDGRELGTAPVKAQLADGAHKLRASLPGYVDSEQAVSTGSNARSFHLSLVPIPLSLEIQSNDEGASVSLNGEDKGKIERGQLQIRQIQPGSPYLLQTKGTHGTASLSFDFTPGQPPTSLDVPAGPAPAVILIAGFGDQARVLSNRTADELTLDGTSLGQVTPVGMLLTVSGNAHELTVGRDFKTQLAFSPSPVLTVRFVWAGAARRNVDQLLSEANALQGRREFGRALQKVLQARELDPKNEAARNKERVLRDLIKLFGEAPL